MQPVPESDWKLFRKLRQSALERFCKRVLDEIETIHADESRSYHSRYLAIYRLLQERDRKLADAFNDPRRSQMIFQLAAIVASGLIEPGELSNFSADTRAAIEVFIGRREKTP